MIKVFALMFSVLLAAASVGGYMFLDAKIIAGEERISDGQKEVDKGQPALDKGKAKLEAGKIELAEGKAKYEKAHDNLFMVVIDKLFNRGQGFEDGRKQIAEGDKQIAQGEAKISAGEKRLAAGELELYWERSSCRWPRACAMPSRWGAIIFGILSIVLAILWRRSLARSLNESILQFCKAFEDSPDRVDESLDQSSGKQQRRGPSLLYFVLDDTYPDAVHRGRWLRLWCRCCSGEIVAQVQGLVGPNGAKAIQALLAAARDPASGLVATLVASLLLLVGASSVFAELKDSLDELWGIAKPRQSAFSVFLRTRLLSFGMVLALAFLLLVSLIVSAVLAMLERYAGGVLGSFAAVLATFTTLISSGVIACMFAIIYKTCRRTADVARCLDRCRIPRVCSAWEIL